MVKRVVVLTVWITLLLATGSKGDESCEPITGEWQGAYKIKPTYFGFSVGYCNYQASMTVYKKGENDYEATIHNQMIEGGGKAEKSCDQSFTVTAQLICDDQGVRLLSNNMDDQTLDIYSKKVSAGQLYSKGAFEHQHGKRKLDVKYTLQLSRRICLAASYHEVINNYNLPAMLAMNNGCRLEL